MSAAGLAHYEFASPTLLAEQPPTLPEELMVPDFSWDVTFNHLEGRMNAMRTVRYSWWLYWAKLAEFVLPRRYTWLVTANLLSRRGSPINQSIVNSTATLAMNICASGMADGVFPPTRPWFKLGIATPGAELQADAKIWLEDSEERAYTVLAQSNFYTIMAQCMQDLTTFGTSPIIMYEDAEDVIRCYGPCAGEYYLAAGSRFSIDTLYREFTLTVAQIVEMFGLEACPSQVRELWEQDGGSLETEFVIAHAIEPNFPLSGRGKSANKKIDVVKGGFTYREVYWLRGVKCNKALSIRGFQSKPFAAFRWSTVSNEPYGRGPAMDALGDTMQIQLEERRKAEGLEKMLRPPMGADVSMKNEPASINPAQITYISTEGGKKGFWPLFEVSPSVIAPVTADIKEVETRIDRAFLVDVWMAISQMEGVQPRNNMEIAERKGEKMQRLGPVVGLIKTEGAQVLLERLLGIMQRRNLLKPLPKSLQGVPLRFDFLDMVTLAQLGAETAGMEQTFAVAGHLSAAAKAAQVPDPIRVLNLDESMRIYADRTNYPARGVFSADEVAQHDQDKARQAQIAQAGAVTLQGVQAAKTLGDTNVGGGNNALSALLGTGPAAASPP